MAEHRAFGTGLHFLATWQAWKAWKDNPRRPRLLHHVAWEATPVAAEEIVRSAQVDPALFPLARELKAQWWGLVPGVHRLSFEQGRVLLTLRIGDPQEIPALERGPRRAPIHGPEPTNAIVIGAGLAGAAAASSLARRGWQVQVLDRAAEPAAGASGLPAGLVAPHTSSDDNLLSRLSRAGVRITLQQARERLVEGVDWQPTGVLEKRIRALPDLGPMADPWQRAVPEGIQHDAAGWIRPAALVRSWLGDAGVQWRGSTAVARVVPRGGEWTALDGGGQVIAAASLVVVAAALDSAALLPTPLALHAVRGQVSLGRVEGGPLAAQPLNSNGHFLPDVPLREGRSWLCGSSYARGDRSLAPRGEDHAGNLQRLRELAPEAAQRLAPAFGSGGVVAWTGIRCASSDRRPLLGEMAPGLWVSTAMGSRGLTFAALCAELLAARLHGEPLPLPVKWAAALDVARQAAPPSPEI